MFRSKRVESEEDSVPGVSKNRSILHQEEEPKRGGGLLNFAILKARRKPKFRNKGKVLTVKQVHKLSSMEPHHIERNHTFKELEYIVESLTKGFNDSGVDVLLLGLVTTPVSYFSMFNLGLAGGIMVTGAGNQTNFISCDVYDLFATGNTHAEDLF